VAVALLWWSSAAAAHSQSARYVLDPIIAGGTNNVAASTTNSTAYWIDARAGAAVGLQVSFSASGAASSDVTFRLYQSLDRTNWYTGAPYTIAVTANGTNTVTYLTNYAVASAGWFTIYSVENPNAAYLTNVTILSAVKRP
jgi:hypothetical protein